MYHVFYPLFTTLSLALTLLLHPELFLLFNLPILYLHPHIPTLNPPTYLLCRKHLWWKVLYKVSSKQNDRWATQAQHTELLVLIVVEILQINDAMNSSKKFFLQPVEEKEKFSRSLNYNHGWVALEKEK